MNAITLSAPTLEGEVLDMAIVDGLEELADGDIEFLNEIFGLYVQSFESTVQTMRESLAGPDADALHRSAHTLKGASANVGARRIAGWAETLQNLGGSGELEGAEQLIDAIVEEYPRVLEALRQRFPDFAH